MSVYHHYLRMNDFFSPIDVTNERNTVTSFAFDDWLFESRCSVIDSPPLFIFIYISARDMHQLFQSKRTEAKQKVMFFFFVIRLR